MAQHMGRGQVEMTQQLELPQEGRQQLEMQHWGLQQLDTQQLGRQHWGLQQSGPRLRVAALEQLYPLLWALATHCVPVLSGLQLLMTEEESKARSSPAPQKLQISAATPVATPRVR
ncbi:hypothetical protein H920_19827 [Fukomys damarensis]|uniref:Uncharacterized protein n=1 Tax=Fukomys damarensis TaxID=885580 RepID=A0A091CMV1_FUKDA|nr:hypothetical protein H920_19827 [Fukomys damarensis]